MTNLDDKTLNNWEAEATIGMGRVWLKGPENLLNDFETKGRRILALVSALQESREEVKVLRDTLLELMASKSISDSEFNLVSNALAWKPSEDES